VIALRIKRSGSWLDPDCSWLLGWKLGRRLWSRVQGHTGVFLTLTYRRDEFENSLDLYRTQSERQDVALFMRRLGRRLGVSFNGKWICKLEFQKGGWVHWHLIVLGVPRIEHDVLSEAWGHGFVWIKKLTKRRVLYTCKYIAKGGAHNLPAWIYAERPKSVKVIRTSRGFWGGASTSTYCPIYAKYGPKRGPSCAAYVAVGDRIKCKGIEIKHARGRFSRRCDPGPVFCSLVVVSRQCGVVRSRCGQV
jgi:hypothetical protein